MTAQTRTKIVRHNTEGLVSRGIAHLVDVHTHVVPDNLHGVDRAVFLAQWTFSN